MDWVAENGPDLAGAEFEPLEEVVEGSLDQSKLRTGSVERSFRFTRSQSRSIGSRFGASVGRWIGTMRQPGYLTIRYFDPTKITCISHRMGTPISGGDKLRKLLRMDFTKAVVVYYAFIV